MQFNAQEQIFAEFYAYSEEEFASIFEERSDPMVRKRILYPIAEITDLSVNLFALAESHAKLIDKCYQIALNGMRIAKLDILTN